MCLMKNLNLKSSSGALYEKDFIKILASYPINSKRKMEWDGKLWLKKNQLDLRCVLTDI